MADEKQAYRARTENSDLQCSYSFTFTRRELFATLGAGLLLTAATDTVAARLHIAADGRVTLLTGKVELGQGVRTLLIQCVSEELRVPPGRVSVVIGDTATVPDDGGTWGSLTTPQTVPVVRRAAATAREYLRTQAAGQWQAELADVVATKGVIRHRDGRTLTYGALTGGKPLTNTVSDAPLTPPRDWQVLGTPLPNVHARDIVTGRHHYITDERWPDCRHGALVRPPAHRATLVSYEATPGVQIVRDGNLLGVVAPDEATARAAAAAIRAEWNHTPLVTEDALAAHFRRTAEAPTHQPGARYPPIIEQGDAAKALEAATQRHEATYTVAYIAHVPLEPRAALARWDKDDQDRDRLTVQSGSQAPFLVRQELARAFQLPESQVRVVTTDPGSGYGGKQRGECELEAARLAKAAGAPVRVAWTREEEFTVPYFRPAGVIDVKSGVDAQGRLVAWDFRNLNAGASSLAAPYAIPHHRCTYWKADSPLRQGSYRSLAAVANTFAREMHMEEWAARLKMDPLEFRLRNLEDARLKEALQRAGERFGWGKRRSGNGVGFGLSCNLEKDGRLALFAEVQADPKTITVRRLVAAVDVGAVLNPDNLRNQIEGAFVQGLGGALFERIRYDIRQVLNPRLSEYRVPRFQDVPEIDVILIDRRDTLSAGAGESPITIVAPAIGAAVRAATGEVVRSLPMRG